MSNFISNRLNENANNDELNYFSIATDDNEIKFLRIPSEDDGSGDENFQFDVTNIK